MRQPASIGDIGKQSRHRYQKQVGFVTKGTFKRHSWDSNFLVGLRLIQFLKVSNLQQRSEYY